jgi:hypothetical protein
MYSEYDRSPTNTKTPSPTKREPRLPGQITKYRMTTAKATVVVGSCQVTRALVNSGASKTIQVRYTVDAAAAAVSAPRPHRAHPSNRPSVAMRPSRHPRNRASARVSKA